MFCLKFVRNAIANQSNPAVIQVFSTWPTVFRFMNLGPIQTAEEVINELSARLYSTGNPTSGFLCEYNDILGVDDLLDETVQVDEEIIPRFVEIMGKTKKVFSPADQYFFTRLFRVCLYVLISLIQPCQHDTGLSRELVERLMSGFLGGHSPLT